jgi:hypothetical protein
MNVSIATLKNYQAAFLQLWATGEYDDLTFEVFIENELDHQHARDKDELFDKLRDNPRSAELIAETERIVKSVPRVFTSPVTAESVLVSCSSDDEFAVAYARATGRPLEDIQAVITDAWALADRRSQELFGDSDTAPDDELAIIFGNLPHAEQVAALQALRAAKAQAVQ